MLAKDAPMLDEYVPARQLVHVVADAVDQEPTLHIKHVPAPAVAHDPAAQAWQTFVEAPIVVEYNPAAQFTHVLDDDAPTSTEYVPALHDKQVVASEAPETDE